MLVKNEMYAAHCGIKIDLARASHGELINSGQFCSANDARMLEKITL